MRLSRAVLVAAVMGSLVAWGGCKGKATVTKAPETSAAGLVRDLGTSDVVTIRLAAATQLEQLPAEQLKPVANDLKKALGKETDSRVKAIIQRVLEKAE